MTVLSKNARFFRGSLAEVARKTATTTLLLALVSCASAPNLPVGCAATSSADVVVEAAPDLPTSDEGRLTVIFPLDSIAEQELLAYSAPTWFAQSQEGFAEALPGKYTALYFRTGNDDPDLQIAPGSAERRSESFSAPRRPRYLFGFYRIGASYDRDVRCISPVTKFILQPSGIH